jgi:DNA-directed RNA polymerase specialized sigma subunit
MSKFDPRFWEILFPPGEMDDFSQEESIWHETEAERRFRYDKEDKKREITPLIMEIVENDLTEMQRNCIKMYFLCGKTQQEVACELGISRRVVTQHIHGIHRRGKQVGGGIRKIRKICEERGIWL